MWPSDCTAITAITAQQLIYLIYLGGPRLVYVHLVGTCFECILRDQLSKACMFFVGFAILYLYLLALAVRPQSWMGKDVFLF